MKKHFKKTVSLLAICSLLFSCTTESVTEGDFNLNESETQAIDGKISVREKPGS